MSTAAVDCTLVMAVHIALRDWVSSGSEMDVIWVEFHFRQMHLSNHHFINNEVFITQSNRAMLHIVGVSGNVTKSKIVKNSLNSFHHLKTTYFHFPNMTKSLNALFACNLVVRINVALVYFRNWQLKSNYLETLFLDMVHDMFQNFLFMNLLHQINRELLPSLSFVSP